MSEDTREKDAAGRLPAGLVQSEAVAVRAALSELARSGSRDLVLDASDVGPVDGCGLQLLLACRNDLVRKGGSLTLLGCSRTLEQTLRLVGLAASFGLRPAGEPR